MFENEEDRPPITIKMTAHDGLVMLDKEVPEGSDPIDQPKSIDSPKGFFGQLLRRLGEN